MSRGAIDRSAGFYDPVMETMAPDARRHFLQERLQDILRHERWRDPRFQEVSV